MGGKEGKVEGFGGQIMSSPTWLWVKTLSPSLPHQMAGKWMLIPNMAISQWEIQLQDFAGTIKT